jgi:hypothetical protein
MRKWVAVALMLAATPAWAADRFDLVCTAGKTPVHYRVDLAAGEWCAGDCSVVNKIAAVTSGMLTLQDEKAIRRSDWENTTTVNRITGEWYSYSYNASLGGLPFQRSGRCEPTTYSGMAKPKF